MAVTPGNIADVAFALQSAKGSPATVSQFRLRMQGGTQLHVEPTKADMEETTGSRMLKDAYYSRVVARGAPSFYVRPEAFGAIAYGVLGAKAVTGSEAPYTHTDTQAATLPYWTFWRRLGNGLYEKFPDCVITALSLTGDAGSPLIMTPTIIGLSASYLSAPEATVALETAYPLKFDHATNAYKVAGSAIRSMRRIGLTIDNGAQEIPGDSLGLFDVAPGRFTASMEGEMLLESFAAYNTQVYGSATPSDGAATISGPVPIGAPGIDFKWTHPAASRSIQLLMPNLQQDPIDPQPNVSGEALTQTVTWRAYEPDSGSPVTLKTENATAAYAAA